MCDCLNKVNEALAAENTQVTSTIGMVDSQLKWLGVEIATHKIDTRVRKPPMRLTAAFCPFCGEEYPEVPKGESLADG